MSSREEDNTLKYNSYISHLKVKYESLFPWGGEQYKEIHYIDIYHTYSIFDVRARAIKPEGEGGKEEEERIRKKEKKDERREEKRKEWKERKRKGKK